MIQDPGTQYFSNLPLWDHFILKTVNEPANQKMVIDHINYAMPLLDHFIVAFPKYTLHNRLHQQNIIRLMGELLDRKLNELSGLESAMLILSAIYHDIGMVFSTTELDNVGSEPDFEIFLKENPKARLQFEEAKKTFSSEIVEWYCRWTHGKRVWIYLNKVDIDIPFLWDDMPFKRELGNVCQSHTESVEHIKRHEENFKTDFLLKCDLTFCSLLLRLSDIMDFDNSRTPKSVYEYLELDKARKGTDAVSDEEWHKHLSSRGFKFDRSKGKTKLLFFAVPEQPKVEINIRKFLGAVEGELHACSKLIKYCSIKWQHLDIPIEINLDNIISKNYKSGNYHFSLSEDSIMTLLTGEGLYDDQYIFLRELLQNALDTSRHREFREKIANTNFKAAAIEVSFFTDRDGYQWFRIDDFGMGMNQEIIQNHLLKKGESYYNSDKFKLERLQIQENEHTDFVPISRFGIGLLSCFMVGDKIEINTMHNDEPNNAYRLSLEGRNGFFMMQTKKDHHQPLPMPSQYPENSAYRTDSGTSIAVRITTNKEFDGFDAQKQLESYLLSAPITVKFNGTKLGGDFEELLINPWTTESSHDLSKDFVNKVEGMTGLSFPKGIQVETYPINITADSLSPKLKGQIVIMTINAQPVEWPKTGVPNTAFRLEEANGKLVIYCNYSSMDDGIKKEEYQSEDISVVMDAIKVPSKMIQTNFFHNDRYSFQGVVLSHNGIKINDNLRKFDLNRYLINQESSYRGSSNNYNFIYTGILYFQDELLPDLTISRNNIKSLSFNIIAQVLTATRGVERLVLFNEERYRFNFFEKIEWDAEMTTVIISKSKFYEENREFWDKYILLNTAAGKISISDLKLKVNQKTAFYIINYSSRFYSNLVKYVIEQNFDVSVKFVKNDAVIINEFYLHPKKTTLPVSSKGFEPLVFIFYDNTSGSLLLNKQINKQHPFIKWYSIAYKLLESDYFYYSRQLIYGLFGSYASFAPEIKMINNILERLRQILPEDLRPPLVITLSEKDFMFTEDKNVI